MRRGRGLNPIHYIVLFFPRWRAIPYTYTQTSAAALFYSPLHNLPFDPSSPLANANEGLGRCSAPRSTTTYLHLPPPPVTTNSTTTAPRSTTTYLHTTPRPSASSTHNEQHYNTKHNCLYFPLVFGSFLHGTLLLHLHYTTLDFFALSLLQGYHKLLVYSSLLYETPLLLPLPPSRMHTLVSQIPFTSFLYTLR